MLNETLPKTLFEAFSIERWNDLIRPFRPVEMDHAAEKMFFVFIIGKHEEKKGKDVNWSYLITHSLFALLRKIALSDIKAPIEHRIRTFDKKVYKKLKDWIFDKYEKDIDNKELCSLFKIYLDSDNEELPFSELSLEEKILRASHQATSFRELEMLSPCNETFRLKDIKWSIEKDVLDSISLEAISLFLKKENVYKLITELEKLRFQTRWNQTPRIPLTSVLGHSYFVAILTLLMCYDLNLSKDRIYTNFFSALFHDVPEVVTRDIISPVKRATEGLPEVVKEIEEKMVEEELLPLIEPYYKEEVLYYIQNEFENRVILDGCVHTVDDYRQLNTEYKDPKYRACDGQIIRLADHIAAFLEAEQSILFGISSAQLEDGRRSIIEDYPTGKSVNGFLVDRFFRKFRSN